MAPTSRPALDPPAVAGRGVGHGSRVDDGLYTDGRDDGAGWALHYSTERELEELTGSFRLRHGGVFGSGHSIVRFMSDRAGEDLVVIGYSDRGACGRYWRGFIDGARHHQPRGRGRTGERRPGSR